MRVCNEEVKFFTTTKQSIMKKNNKSVGLEKYTTAK
jgi:hypothetical protein